MRSDFETGMTGMRLMGLSHWQKKRSFGIMRKRKREKDLIRNKQLRILPTQARHTLELPSRNLAAPRPGVGAIPHASTARRSATGRRTMTSVIGGQDGNRSMMTVREADVRETRPNDSLSLKGAGARSRRWRLTRSLSSVPPPGR